jgi:hypothetical protein
MVLERARRPEGRHHRVPGELLGRPAGTLDFLRHRLVEPVEQNTRALRILRAGKSRRADQVREQNSRQLPLLGWPLG